MDIITYCSLLYQYIININLINIPVFLCICHFKLAFCPLAFRFDSFFWHFAFMIYLISFPLSVGFRRASQADGLWNV